MASNGLVVSGIAAVALAGLTFGSEAHAHKVHNDWHGHHHHHGSKKKQKAYDKGYRKGYKHAVRSTGSSWIRVVHPTYRPIYRPVPRRVVVSPYHSWLNVGLGVHF